MRQFDGMLTRRLYPRLCFAYMDLLHLIFPSSSLLMPKCGEYTKRLKREIDCFNRRYLAGE
jgi:hypothetical protein